MTCLLTRDAHISDYVNVLIFFDVIQTTDASELSSIIDKMFSFLVFFLLTASRQNTEDEIFYVS